MNVFRRKKKKEQEKNLEETTKHTLLDVLCAEDEELKNALSRTLLLNPVTTREMGSIEMHIENARNYQKNKDYARARVEYQVAGELSLYEGKLIDLQCAFKKAAEVDPNYPQNTVYEYFVKVENAEKAIAVAKEYYARTAKLLEK